MNSAPYNARALTGHLLGQGIRVSGSRRTMRFRKCQKPSAHVPAVNRLTVASKWHGEFNRLNSPSHLGPR